MSENYVSVPQRESQAPRRAGFTASKFFAEMIGTAGLTFLACGVAVLSGVDMVATSLAFGLVIIAMAFSIGNVSGCHINPAVSIAFLIRDAMTGIEFIGYICAQFVGGFLGSTILGLCKRGNFTSLGSNSIQPGLKNAKGESDGWSYAGAILIEIFLTFVFCLTIVGVCDNKKYRGNHQGIVIGCTLTLVVATGLRLTGTSVNPARSLAPAAIEAMAKNKDAIKEIWIFLSCPCIGGALAGWIYGLLVYL